MKKIFYLLAIILFLNSCNDNSRHEKLISRIKNSNYMLFFGVTMEARNTVNEKVKAPFLTKEINGKRYLLPNFNYYNCQKPLEKCLRMKKITKKFDIEKYNLKFNENKDVDAYTFTYNSTNAIFKEFEHLNVYRVLSRSSIGNCIIFYINENEYLAYVPDVNSLKNYYWISRFKKDKKEGKYWHSGTLDK